MEDPPEEEETVLSPIPTAHPLYHVTKRKKETKERERERRRKTYVRFLRSNFPPCLSCSMAVNRRIEEPLPPLHHEPSSLAPGNRDRSYGRTNCLSNCSLPGKTGPVPGGWPSFFNAGGSDTGRRESDKEGERRISIPRSGIPSVETR